MLMIQELISVIIPAYNSSTYIKDTLKSIINNDYKNIEIIVVDDNSTDDTLTIVGDIAQKNDCIKIIKHSDNQGVSFSRLDGFNASKGKWVMFLDHDDVITPYAISSMVELLRKHSDADVVTGMIESLNDEEIDALLNNYSERVNSTSIFIESPVWKEFYLRLNPNKIFYNISGILIYRELVDKLLVIVNNYNTIAPWMFMDDPIFIPIMLYYSKGIAFQKRIFKVHRSNNGSLSSQLNINNYYRQWTRAAFSVAEYIRSLCNDDYYYYLLNDAMEVAQSMYWRVNEKEENKQLKDIEICEITSLVDKYREDYKSYRAKLVGNKILKYISTRVFLINKKLWKNTIGDFYFGYCYHPYGAKK